MKVLKKNKNKDARILYNYIKDLNNFIEEHFKFQIICTNILQDKIRNRNKVHI